MGWTDTTEVPARGSVIYYEILLMLIRSSVLKHPQDRVYHNLTTTLQTATLSP